MCEVGKGDGVRDQQQSRRYHGQGRRALAVQCWHRCSRVWGGPAAARLPRLHERSHTVPGDAADRVLFYYFKLIIFLCSRARGRYGGASSTLLLCLITDQVDDQELRIVSIYLFIRIFFCTKSIHQNLATFICSSGCAAAGKWDPKNWTNKHSGNWQQTGKAAIHSLCISDSLPWQ